MERLEMGAVLWMVGSFAVGAVAFSPLDGAVLSGVTTFGFWATVKIREIYG